MPDPVDRLILDELGAPTGPVVILDDTTGQLTANLLDNQLRVHCDDLRARHAIPAGVDQLPLGPDLFTDAQTVVGRLPRSLDVLDHWSRLIADHAHRDVRVVLGSRVKHMTRSMNDVLARHFDQVHASLGRSKSRVLHAAIPRDLCTASPSPHKASPWPRSTNLSIADCPTIVVTYPGVFSAGRVDAGTRLLLSTLASADLPSGPALDFGCGWGALSVWLARRGQAVTAVDVSAAACASTTDTLRANGLDAEVLHLDGTATLPDRSVDLIVANPPFHRGAAKDSTPTMDMIDDAARLLRPGGQLWLVYNSHLPYLPALRRRLASAQVVARDRHYVVVAGRR